MDSTQQLIEDGFTAACREFDASFPGLRTPTVERFARERLHRIVGQFAAQVPALIERAGRERVVTEIAQMAAVMLRQEAIIGHQILVSDRPSPI